MDYFDRNSWIPLAPALPASILQYHKNVYIVADEAALSLFG